MGITSMGVVDGMLIVCSSLPHNAALIVHVFPSLECDTYQFLMYQVAPTYTQLVYINLYTTPNDCIFLSVWNDCNFLICSNRTEFSDVEETNLVFDSHSN